MVEMDGLMAKLLKMARLLNGKKMVRSTPFNHQTH
jgi:hypothetical protein